jgi:hypothetical protein
MKKNALMVLLLLAIVGSFSSSAYALTVTIGKPLEVFADPSDVVVALDTAGQPLCTSKFFIIQRANTNFKELTAVVLTAFSSGKTLRLFVSGCSGGRSIVSHAGMF